MLSSFAPVVATLTPAGFIARPDHDKPAVRREANVGDNPVMGQGLNEILLVDVPNPCDFIAACGHSQLAVG